MFSSRIRLLPLFVLILSFSTTSLLFGQTPTPTPPIDTDGDGVRDHKDGWPEHTLIFSPRVPETEYVAIKLGSGTGYGINNRGDVVGWSEDNGNREAVLWKIGVSPTFLGFITNDQDAWRQSVATAINDAGVVTGFATYTWDPNVTGTYPNPPVYPQLLNYPYDSFHSNYWDTHAFRWESGVMADLNDLSFGQAESPDHPNGANKGSSSGLAINQSGQIVGESDSSIGVSNAEWNWQVTSDVKHPVAFSIGGQPQDLNLASASAEYVSSEAKSINDQGAIVGWGAGDGYSAFFTGGGAVHFLDPVPDQNGVSYDVLANGINNLNHVVGSLGASNSAFIWVPTSDLPASEPRFIDLKTVSLAAGFRWTEAAAINDRDQIVGSGYFGSSGTSEAVLWQNGKLHRLNDLIGPHPDFNLEAATAINQNGMIVANSPNNFGQAYLVVPIEFVEASPKTTDENGSIVVHSDKPKRLPHSNEVVEEPRSGQTPNVAYRVLKIRVSESFAGERIKWSMTPLFEPAGSGTPLFRGTWPQEHPNRFEADDHENYYQFAATSQQEGTTVIDLEGETAVRINLPAVGFNKARVRIEFERFSSTGAEIDFEVPAVVVIDPGHGGSEDLPGSDANHAESPSHVLEKDMTLAYGLALQESLREKVGEKKLRMKIFMTRTADVNVPGATRSHTARDNGADVILIIHFNSSESHTARGTLEVRRKAGNVNQDEDVDFIKRVINKVVPAIADYDSGARKLDHVVVNTVVASDVNLGNATIHGIRAGYIEVEFIDNPAIDTLLNSGPNAANVKQAIVDAMREGIIQDLKHQPTIP